MAFIVKPAVHFVGFRKEEYWSAVKIWGKPDFFHIGNDTRLRLEIHPSDTVVYANGYERKNSYYNYEDILENRI